MHTKKKQDQQTIYERNGQLVLAMNSEMMIPENAPVRLLSAQLREKIGGGSPSAAVRSLLEEEARENIFISGKRKSQAQRDWEEKQALLERWERYEVMRSTMGEGRNSYSKTDPDATFMRMNFVGAGI